MIGQLTVSNSLTVCLLFLTFFYQSREEALDHYYPPDGPKKEEPNVPVFRPTEQNYTVGPGDKAKLTCRVDNLGTKTVVWRRKGERHPLTIGLFTYVPDERISVDYNQRANEWTLDIQNVSPKDEGFYLCTISTKEQSRKKWYQVHLTVKTVQVQAMDSPFIEKGHVIHLRCNATGKPNPPNDVNWYKDGQPITSDATRGVIITKSIEIKQLISTLTITFGKLSDKGVYTCLSTNRDAASVEIHVLDVPNPVPVDKRDSNGVSAHSVAGSRGAATSLYFTNSLVTLSTFFVFLHLSNLFLIR